MAKSRRPSQPRLALDNSLPCPPPTIFYCYPHSDEKYRRELHKHLATVRRSYQIVTWYDQEILPGDDFNHEIDLHLETSDIVLLLISSDFLDSYYCYSVEMKRAIERHQAGLARVIPIILRPCDWQNTPIGRLQALPRDGKPVSLWHSRDKALLDVATGVRRALETLLPNILPLQIDLPGAPPL